MPVVELLKFLLFCEKSRLCSVGKLNEKQLCK